MKQRGRQSQRAADLELLSVDGKPDRLRPPDHLSADERRRFAEIVSTCDTRHFRPSDVTLLCRFVEADALAEKAAKELRTNPVTNGKPSAWLGGAGKIRAGPDGTVHAAAAVTAIEDRQPKHWPTGTAFNREPMGVDST